MSSSNFQTWIQGDGFWFITGIAMLLVIGAWRNSSWGKLFSTLVFWGILASMSKGTQLLSALGWFLRLFGIETGL